MLEQDCCDDREDVCGPRPTTDGKGTCQEQCGNVGYGAPDDDPCYWYLAQFANAILSIEFLAEK